MASKKKVEVILAATDKTAPAFRSVTGGIRGVMNTQAGMFAAAAAGSAAMVGGIVAIGRAYAGAVKDAAKFQRRMAEVNTMVDGTASEQGQLRDIVLDTSVAYGQLADNVGQAAYDIASAGFAGVVQQQQLLGSSAKLAVAGVSSIDRTADLLTTTLNAYSMEAGRAEEASGLLFGTVKAGKTTIGNLADDFGKVASNAALAGVPLEEVLAAIAAVTARGRSTSEATTAINALIMGIVAGSPQAAAKLRELNINLDRGLGPALKRLNEVGVESIAMLRELVPEKQALAAAASAGANEAEGFYTALDKVRGGVVALDKAHREMEKTAAQQMARTEAAIAKLKITAGSTGLNILAGESGDLADAIDELSESLEDGEAKATNWLRAWAGTQPILGELINLTGQLADKHEKRRERAAAAAEAEATLMNSLYPGGAPPLLPGLPGYEPPPTRELPTVDPAAAWNPYATASLGPGPAIAGADHDVEARQRMMRIWGEESPDMSAEMNAQIEDGILMIDDWQDSLGEIDGEFTDIEVAGVAAFEKIGAQAFDAFAMMLMQGGDVEDMLGNMVKQFALIGVKSLIGLPFAAGGTVPGAAAGYSVSGGMRGMDSVLINAQHGEEVVSRRLSQRLDRFLGMVEVGQIQGGGGDGGRNVTVVQQIARPIKRSDFVNMGRDARRAVIEADKGVL